MAYAAENEITSLYAENTLRRHTANSMTMVSQLLTELRRIRAQGHGAEEGEWRPGVEGFAVPIFNPEGHVNLAIWALASPGSELMRDADRSVRLAARAAHDIIVYATGKHPLVWPRDKPRIHPEKKDFDDC
ncbi:MAG: IclR family transcriptional regulator C-terminal domain-containing protein [Alphaproteobacteria bacterium]